MPGDPKEPRKPIDDVNVEELDRVIANQKIPKGRGSDEVEYIPDADFKRILQNLPNPQTIKQSPPDKPLPPVPTQSETKERPHSHGIMHKIGSAFHKVEEAFQHVFDKSHDLSKAPEPDKSQKQKNDQSPLEKKQEQDRGDGR